MAEAPRWDGFTAQALAARCGVPRVEVLAETSSTLDVAHALAELGAPPGTLVIADKQRAGRGRMGRAWSSPAGRGVWLTMVARPADLAALDVLSIRVGLGAAEALDSSAGAAVRLKWPNDLLTDAGKLGGILVETRWAGPKPSWVAVGVGVNVEAPRDQPQAAGLPGASRVAVLAALARAVHRACAASGHLTDAELAAYGARDILRGRRLAAPAVGTAIGVAADGALIVETAQGRTTHRSGTVRFAEDV